VLRRDLFALSVQSAVLPEVGLSWYLSPPIGYLLLFTEKTPTLCHWKIFWGNPGGKGSWR